MRDTSIYRSPRLSIGCLGILAILLAACGAPNLIHPQGSQEPRVLYRDPGSGRTFTEADVAGVSGRVDWDLAWSATVPADVRRMDQQARQETAVGNAFGALSLLEEAHRAAPDWPYPVYDAAWTYLLMGEWQQAEDYYQETDRLAPRGFFTSKVAMDSLRREREGLIRRGSYLRLLAVDDVSEQERKREQVQQIVDESPAFPAAWQALASLTDDQDARLEALEHGLALDPDPDTRGLLLIEKARVIAPRGQTQEATTILGQLALDPSSPLDVEHIAKMTLPSILQEHPTLSAAQHPL